MSPVENADNKFIVRFKDSQKETINADTVCRPKGGPAGSDYFVFKKNKEIVAEYHKSDVSGWRFSSEGDE